MSNRFIKIFTVCMCLLLAGGTAVQAKDADKEAKKLEKAEKKRLKARQDSIDFARAKDALESMYFIVKAYQLALKDMRTVYPDVNTNYLALQKDKAVVQITSDSGYVGPNGIGGITVEGSLSNIKSWEDKKGNFFLEFNVNGLAIAARVDIKLPVGSKKATVNIYPNFNSTNIRMYGNVEVYDAKSIFQGRVI